MSSAIPAGMTRTAAIFTSFAAAFAFVCLLAPHAVAQDPPQTTADYSSPRAALFTFLDAMNAVQGGRPERLDEAVAAIDLSDLPQGERRQAAIDRSEQIYEILDEITIDAESVPDETESAEIDIELGDAGHVILSFRKSPEGTWRFSYALDDADPEPAAEDAPVPETQAGRQPQATGANPNLSDPRTTMRTFIEAFNHWQDGGREEAVATLDLAALDIRSDAVLAEKGEELAVQLKQILDRDRLIVYQLIPNAPDGPAYVHLRDPMDVTGQRVIEIVPITPDPRTEAREWKFSARTVAAIPAIWDLYKDRVPVAGVDADTPRLLSLQIRAWVAVNTPFLLNDPLILQNWQWLGILFTIALGLAVSRAAAYMILLLIRRSFRRERMDLDQQLEKDFVRPIRIALMAWVWYVALRPLGLPPNLLEILRNAVITISAAGFVWALYRLIDIFGGFLTQKAARTENRYDDLVVPLVTRTLKIFVVTFGILFVAEVNGQDLTTMLAGLGIGGLAFALAAKDTLGNMFGSITVLVDKPFQIGDWIEIGGVEGTVESVGVRSTRIRTFYDSQVTVPNSQLTSAVIDNYGQRKFRRTRTLIGVTYDTAPEKIEAFCEGIRELIRQHPYTRKDNFHVYLNQFGPSSLDILLYCFHECPDWATELRERHRLYLDIVRLAERLGVAFAFPTSTIHLHREEPSGNGDALPHTDAPGKGRAEARAIVHEFLGTHGAVPPPVNFAAAPHEPGGDL